MVTSVAIRPIRHGDWAEIWPFFRDIVLAGETYAYDPEWTSQEAEPVWVEQSPGHTVVATLDDAIVGSAKMGPNRPARGSHVSTASFMVDPSNAGRGAGRALCTYALAWARAQGYHSMQFNAVVETNERAVELWKSLGFTIIGTVPEAFDHPTHGKVGLHVMYQRL
jgi:L-amino acid N-acyltransferase YncA